MPKLIQAYVAAGFCAVICQNGVFDNGRGVRADTQFKEQYIQVLVPAYKVMISLCRLIPAIILNKFTSHRKFIVHGRTADRTFWNKFRLYFHILLFRYHFADGVLIIIGHIMTSISALP